MFFGNMRQRAVEPRKLGKKSSELVLTLSSYFMNDRRVNAIRDALEAFVESVDATSRIARWGQLESVPDSLRRVAARLEANKKLANNLVIDNAIGAPGIVQRLSLSSSAIRMLSTAYDEFSSRRLDPSTDISVALADLDAAIDSANEALRDLVG